MKRKRWVLLLALVFSLQVILAACSGNNNSGGSGESQQPSNGGQSPSGDVVEIVMWHMEEPPNRVQRFQEIADAFNAANPDIRVIPQVQSWGDAYTRFPAAIQAGRGPDLLFTIPDYTTLINSLGVTQPVDDIVADLDAKHKFLEAALTPYQYDGHTWAVPLYGMVQVLWYRKDILDEAGIEPPKNWDDLKAAVETLTTKDRYGIALPASRSLATDQVIYTFMITSGAKDIIDENNNVTFNNEKTVRAYQMYADLLKFSPPDSNTYQWGEPQAQFNAGKAAMAIEKGQYLSVFEEESGRPASDLGVIPMPVADGGEEGSIYYSNGVMVLTDDPAKKEAIKKFLDYLLEPETYGKFLNAEPGLFLPVTETGSNADSFWNDPVIQKYKSQVDVLLEASAKGQLFGFTKGVSQKIGQISGPNYLSQVLEQITVNGMSPADAVAWGQQQMENAVK